MDMEAILELTWVPVIAFGISLGYAVILLYTGNPKILVSKKDPKPIRNEKKYAKESGKLLLFFAAASLLNVVLLLVSFAAALIEIVAAIGFFGMRWKKVSSLYGPIG